jgi:hypothetical protein
MFSYSVVTVLPTAVDCQVMCGGGGRTATGGVGLATRYGLQAAKAARTESIKNRRIVLPPPDLALGMRPKSMQRANIDGGEF